MLPFGELYNHAYRAGSAASFATRHDFDIDYLLSGRVLHLTGITAMISSSGHELVVHLAREARRRGVHLSVDANVRRRLLGDRDATKLLAPLIRASDTLFLSRSEAVLLLGTDEPVRLQVSLPAIAATAIVVHDPQGATVITRSEIATADARRVDVVDPTGAGDALVGGYLSGWLESSSLAERLRRAQHCAALAVTSRGDSPVCVTRVSASTSCEADGR